MTTLSPDIVLAATTPAQHYAWIAAVSNALDTLGVIRTSDSGQVALGGITTLPLPTGTGAVSGNFWGTPVYEIRKLSAAGKPDIFLRIDYGIYYNLGNSASPTQYFYPALNVTVGKGSNGAGLLTALKPNTANVNFMSASSSGFAGTYYAGSSSNNSRLPSAFGQRCDFASDGQNYLTMMIGENAPVGENFSIFDLAVERSIDASTGEYDADGIVAFAGQAGGSAWYYGDFTNSLQWNGTSGMPAIAPPFNIGTSALIVDIFPFMGCTLVPKGAPTCALSYYSSGVNSPVAFPSTLYGTTHTFKACSRSVCQADPYSTGTKLALRFD